MDDLWLGFIKALQLIGSLDPEVIDITVRSLAISATSCAIACVVCFPLAGLVHFSSFPGKRLLVAVVQTLYSLPTVLVGLFVFLLLSRSGPLGSLGLLFTPVAMVIGQVLLVTPIMLGLAMSALGGVDASVHEMAVALGADRWQAVIKVMGEARYAIFAAAVMGFGRAISEVGLSVMVGGNIKGFTRTLTTAISLEVTKGDIELSIALGLILLAVALMVNLSISWLQHR